MDAKEAIEYLKNERGLRASFSNVSNMTRAFVNEAAIKALEKQIPKKPVGDLDSVPHYRCPNCQAGVVLYRDSTKFPCCQYCGQKLDWSEN